MLPACKCRLAGWEGGSQVLVRVHARVHPPLLLLLPGAAPMLLPGAGCCGGSEGKCRHVQACWVGGWQSGAGQCMPGCTHPCCCCQLLLPCCCQVLAAVGGLWASAGMCKLRLVYGCEVLGMMPTYPGYAAPLLQLLLLPEVWLATVPH